MTIEYVATAKLPTKHGKFDITSFEDKNTGEEHVMLSLNLKPKSENGGKDLEDPILIRLHSECVTGDAFSSLRCDCGPQLDAALDAIQKEGKGALLYLRQEGRGIGLPNKIRAYALQDQGHDTLDANLMLGLPADGRTYDMTKTMLDHFGIKKVNLMTNNPNKQHALEDLGIEVVDRKPLHQGYNRHNKGYIKTKRERMGHLT